MDKNQLDGLLALKLVADKRNFTAAAQVLRVSPSAISKMIRQLETRLGVTLLTRTTRTTSLTEAGERFLSQAGPALEVILAAMEDAGSLAEKPAGRLRLNAPQMIYPNFLKEVVSSFSNKYPDVSVEIFLENAATDIFERGFDAGIRVSDILAKDMVVPYVGSSPERRDISTGSAARNIRRTCCPTTASAEGQATASTTGGNSKARARPLRCR
jgi:DNA-binding transcriptional LysR family regulator